MEGRRGGELGCPAAHYWLLMTAFSPETLPACSVTPSSSSQPPPRLPLHYWFTARGSSGSRHACHESEIAMSSSFSLCSFGTALALLLLLLLLAAGTRVPRHWALRCFSPIRAFLRSFSAIFLLFRYIFRSMFSLVCFSNLLWTLAEPARWIIFFLDS